MQLFQLAELISFAVDAHDLATTDRESWWRWLLFWIGVIVFTAHY